MHLFDLNELIASALIVQGFIVAIQNITVQVG